MKTKSTLLLVTILLGAVLITQSVQAAGIVDCAGGNNQCTLSDLFHTVLKIINFLIGMSWLVAVYFVFWGAYSLSTSYGNSEKIEAGKKIIQNAIIGFFLILTAFILINWIVMVLGGYSFNELIKFLPFT